MGLELNDIDVALPTWTVGCMGWDKVCGCSPPAGRFYAQAPPGTCLSSCHLRNDLQRKRERASAVHAAQTASSRRGGCLGARLGESDNSTGRTRRAGGGEGEVIHRMDRCRVSDPPADRIDRLQNCCRSAECRHFALQSPDSPEPSDRQNGGGRGCCWRGGGVDRRLLVVSAGLTSGLGFWASRMNSGYFGEDIPCSSDAPPAGLAQPRILQMIRPALLNPRHCLELQRQHVRQHAPPHASNRLVQRLTCFGDTCYVHTYARLPLLTGTA